jgi:hypothetical protein
LIGAENPRSALTNFAAALPRIGFTINYNYVRDRYTIT